MEEIRRYHLIAFLFIRENNLCFDATHLHFDFGTPALIEKRKKDQDAGCKRYDPEVYYLLDLTLKYVSFRRKTCYGKNQYIKTFFVIVFVSAPHEQKTQLLHNCYCVEPDKRRWLKQLA